MVNPSVIVPHARPDVDVGRPSELLEDNDWDRDEDKVVGGRVLESNTLDDEVIVVI